MGGNRCAHKLQRIGPVAVRGPLHALEVAPARRRVLDRPHAGGERRAGPQAPVTGPGRTHLGTVVAHRLWGRRAGRAGTAGHERGEVRERECMAASKVCTAFNDSPHPACAVRKNSRVAPALLRHLRRGKVWIVEERADLQDRERR